VGAEVLSPRALNRALLARQLLLARADVAAVDAVERLVGLQAQVPANPYTALWSRLEGFRTEELSEAFEQRQVVRISVMRATIHLVSAADCLVLRPLTQPVLHAELTRHPQFGPPLRGLDLAPVLGAARPLLAERPLTLAQLRAALGERFPQLDAGALAYACRCELALVQVPPRGLWGRSAQAAYAEAETWLGRPLGRRPSLDDVVLRYLGAFGPATAADVATWSRLTGLAAVLERLRPRLETFRDERGRELFDLPDAPRPDASVPAPVRFLPEYDNVLLSHGDRSRIVPAGIGKGLAGRLEGLGHGSVLVDGFFAGMWRPEAKELIVRLGAPLSKRASASVVAEGRRLLRFLGDQTEAEDVRLLGPD
jgi:hypothetical protein